MNDHVFHRPPKESKRAALILSVLVHLILVGALFYGVQWSNNPSMQGAMMAVEVWNGKPSPTRASLPPAPSPPPPPVETTQPKPPPPPPVKKPEAAEKTPEIKPDILVKDEEEKRKKAEEKRKQEEAKRKEEEKKKQDELKRQEDEKLKKEEAKRKENEKLQQEIADKLKADTQKAAKDRDELVRKQTLAGFSDQLNADTGSAAIRGAADKYIGMITNRIRGNIILPLTIQGNPEAIVKVKQAPNGEVLSVKIEKTSGNKLLDEAIVNAVIKSSPLPMPEKPLTFEQVRDLQFKYRPFEVQ